MPRTFILLAATTFLSMFVVGYASAYVPVKAASIPSATMMKVHIGSGEKVIDADITDADEITAVLGFINTHLDSWKPVEGNPPTTEVNVRFFNGSNAIGTFGSDANFFTRGNPASLTHSASAKDVTDFLNLANIDPAKLAHPPHD